MAGYPVVRALEIDTDFPHAMTIRVVEHRPVAVVITGGVRLPVAADGTVLEGLPADGGLPLVRAQGGLKSSRLADPSAIGAARIAGAAPVPLRRRLREIAHESDRGYVVKMRKGPELVFGSAAHLGAKWVAAARVLADGDTQGATYVDLTVPGRPAVGGLGFEVTAPALPTAPLPLGTEEGDVAGATARTRAAIRPSPGHRARGPGRGAGAGGGLANASGDRARASRGPRHTGRRGRRGSGRGARSLSRRRAPRKASSLG